MAANIARNGGWRLLRPLFLMVAFALMPVLNAHGKQPALPRQGVDLAISGKDIRVFTEADGRLSIILAIHNLGNQISPQFRVDFYAGDPAKGGKSSSDYRLAGPIRPGDTWHEGWPCVLPGKARRLFIVLDQNHAVADPDRANNKASCPLPSTPSGGGSHKPASPSSGEMDLAVAADSLHTFFDLRGGRFVEATIRNLSDRPALDIDVNFSETNTQDPHSEREFGRGFLSLGPHESASEAIPWDSKPGQYLVQVCLDPHNELKDKDQRNNNAERTLEIKDWPLPGKAQAAVPGSRNVGHAWPSRPERQETQETQETFARLSGESITDMDMERLRGNTVLRDLYLNSAHVTGKGLAALKGLTTLRSLTVQDSPVGDEGLPQLAGLKSLMGLSLFNCPIGDAGFANLRELPALNSISIGKLKVTDKGLAVLQTIPSLRSVHIFNMPITDVGLSCLEGLKLNSLELVFLDISDQGLASLSKMTTLTELVFHHDRIGDAGLARLEKLKNLQQLWLTGTRISDNGLAHLRGFTLLADLCLRYTAINGSGLTYLKDLPVLAELNLRTTRLRDAGLRNLQGFKSLKKLDLSDTKIGGSGLEVLLSLPALEDLNLAQTSITDASALKYLTQLKHLRQLDLRDTMLSEQTVADLRRTLNINIFYNKRTR